MSDQPIGKTARGHAVYAPTHPSYSHLEKVRMVGADTNHLAQLARQAHPHYRAVDHEEASVMHHARRNFHAARAHEAASAAMSKSMSDDVTPAFMSDLAWVYAGATPDLSLADAAGAIRACTLNWTAQDHLDEAVLQHCYADGLGDDPKKQAVCAAAAFMHFAAADVDPMTTGLAKGQKPLGAAFSHARRVAAKTGGGKAKERAVAQRYLSAKGHGKMAVKKALDPKALTPRVPRTPKQIGVTRSNKPIYDVHNHPAHKDFNAADNMDAVRALGRRLTRQSSEPKTPK